MRSWVTRDEGMKVYVSNEFLSKKCFNLISSCLLTFFFWRVYSMNHNTDMTKNTNTFRSFVRLVRNSWRVRNVPIQLHFLLWLFYWLYWFSAYDRFLIGCYTRAIIHVLFYTATLYYLQICTDECSVNNTSDTKMVVLFG